MLSRGGSLATRASRLALSTDSRSKLWDCLGISLFCDDFVNNTIGHRRRSYGGEALAAGGGSSFGLLHVFHRLAFALKPRLYLQEGGERGGRGVREGRRRTAER